jgi:hypothetical protein
MKITETIYYKWIEGDNATVRVSDLMDLSLLRPDDIIDIVKDEGYYSENNSWDPFTEIIIYREREETEAEKNIRETEAENDKIEMRAIRYKRYLELKEEFENGTL